MKVVVNQTAARGYKTGIGHYTTQLLRCLREQVEPEEVAAFPEGWYWRLGHAFARLRAQARATGFARPRGGLSRPLKACLRAGVKALPRGWSNRLSAALFRLTAHRRGFDLYHEPNYIPFPCDLPTVTTIHDLSVLHFPEWHPRERVAHFERHFYRGLAQCRHFLTISEFGRQEVIRVLGLPPERVTCTYMGIRPDLRPLPRAAVTPVLKRLGLPQQYLLHLGTIEPRKNLLRLLRVYCSLPSELRSRWPLLLVGDWGWNCADVAEYLQNEARHRGVIHVGYVADEDVPALYNGACALVYPTLYEGFGIPPLEMMACGGAVLTSTAGALKETLGKKAHGVDPLDDDGWRRALMRLLRDDDWRESLRRGATAVARPYTWDRCAAETYRVYRRLCGVSEVQGPFVISQGPADRSADSIKLPEMERAA
jgi:glycosyltransferase involved in cell wall biosynthesis